MPIYQIDGLTPVVPEESFVHPTAVLIGDVILGKGVYVGPNAACVAIWSYRGERWREHSGIIALCTVFPSRILL
ncbi:phenylacetic acid degradation protein [Escherichia coli]|nr:phenylacetic acid degradation protein [Escherichia coli]